MWTPEQYIFRLYSLYSPGESTKNPFHQEIGSNEFNIMQSGWRKTKRLIISRLPNQKMNFRTHLFPLCWFKEATWNVQLTFWVILCDIWFTGNAPVLGRKRKRKPTQKILEYCLEAEASAIPKKKVLFVCALQ